MIIEDIIMKNDEYFVQNTFGYCYYGLIPTPIVYNLYIHPQYRGMGYSKFLLYHVINEIRHFKPVGQINVEVEPREDCMSPDDLAKYYGEMGLTVVGWYSESKEL